MSELRQDRTSGRWVIIAPERGYRLGASQLVKQSSTASVRTRQFAADCPFCPGHEVSLPGIIAEVPFDSPPGWIVRVVPNKFPALQPDHKIKNANRHCVAAGYGFHEVIIESPRHDADLISMTDAEIEAVVSTYHDRIRHLMEQHGIEAVVLFRNTAGKGGASLAHPHAQVLALGFVPPMLSLLAQHGDRYYHDYGCCPTCHEIAIERELNSRIVEDTQCFLVLVPFAAEHPYEIWIVPKEHQASFLYMHDSQLAEFAWLLRRTLGRLKCARGDPPYNFVIDSADRMQLQSPYLHWRLRIAPDLATWGGFELGAGTAINPSIPEDDAVMLRSVGIRT